MGKGQGVVDATFKLICMAVYAAYILIGMGVCIIAVLYWSSTAVASGVVSGLLLLSGFVMIGVGSAAIYGIHKDHVLVLSVVWCAPVHARARHTRRSPAVCIHARPSTAFMCV
jgi:hypothetical protein